MRSFYGDSTRWFVGKVIDIIDPLELGRVKVRIFGIHGDNLDDIDNYDLPWAQVMTPSTEGGSSGIGANVGIKPMAQVFGMFLDGQNSQMPIILGSIPKYESVDDLKREVGYTTQSSQHADEINGAPNMKNKLVASEVDKVKLQGKDNIEKAYKYFLSPEGGSMEPFQAAAIIGNLYHESRVDPTAISGVPGEGSYGIAQWNPATDRYKKLHDFCIRNNLSSDSLYGQLSYLKHEFYSVRYLGLSQFLDAENVDDACEIFEKKYERPQPGSTEARQQKAREILKKMTET